MSLPPPEAPNDPPVAPVPPPTQAAIEAERAAAFRHWHGELRSLSPWAPVTPILVALNVVVFVVMAASGVKVLDPTAQTLLGWGANFGPASVGGEWWRLVTCAFLHSGVMHLAFNMFCLAGVGRATERMIGSPGFLFAYLSSAVAGSLASVIWTPAVVSVGASGAVFGTFGAFFAASLRAAGTIPRPALDAVRVNMGKLLALNLAVGFFVPNVDVAAHVGGLLWGFACGYLLGHPLTTEAVKRRKSRNLIAAAVFVPVVALGFVAAGNRVGTANDASSELTRIGMDEERVLNVYNDAIQKSTNGTMTDGQFLTVLEDDVIRPWNDMRRRFDQLRDNSGLNPQFVKQYGEYLALRGEAFALLRAAVATNDPGAAARSREKMTQADRIVTQLRDGR